MNTYHATTKMKPINVKSGTYIEFNVENNDNDPKFEVGDHVGISKYKNFFTEIYAPRCSEEAYEIKKCLKSCSVDINTGRF